MKTPLTTLALASVLGMATLTVDDVATKHTLTLDGAKSAAQDEEVVNAGARAIEETEKASE